MTTLVNSQATIQRLSIRNYRVLRDVQFSDLTPLTVLLGPNGSGKSTVVDVFAFPHEAFTTNLRGFTRSVRASDMVQVVAQADAGGLRGSLWMEGYFDAGDPLVRGGRPRVRVGA